MRCRRGGKNAPEVDETSLGEEDDVASGRHGVTVDLGLDVGGLDGVGLDPGDVDLNVEVTDAAREEANQPELGDETQNKLDSLADDGVLGHGREVLATDDVAAASGGDEDVSLRSSVFHGGDLETGHRGLESVDGVDLGDDDAGSVGAEGLGALEEREKRSATYRKERRREDDALPFRHLRNRRRQRPFRRA